MADHYPGEFPSCPTEGQHVEKNESLDQEIVQLDEENVDFASDEDILEQEQTKYDDTDDMQVQVQMGEVEQSALEFEPCADGILDKDTVGEGLSNLGRSADGTQLVYLHLTLPGMSLLDINVLEDYIHLQRVELPYNQLTNIDVLGNMEHLLELDLSHNKLTAMLDFKPPRNLRVVNLSYNMIPEIVDLTEHQCLTTLILDYNGIKKMEGLENCKRLTHLSLGHNEIEKIEGIENLPLKYLNLASNKLSKIENISTLKYLQEINASKNKIRSLEGFENLGFLETIDMENNEVIDMSEIQNICNLKMLRTVNLKNNPIQDLPDYRLSVLFHLQLLNELDRKHVDAKEKVSAHNLFNPPLEVIAARDHIMHVVYSFLQPNTIRESTLPSIETPYPILVLVGPQGAGKKELAMKLVEEFPDFFGFGVCHTTREPRPEEEMGKDYHFVSVEEFEESVKLGRFIQTYSYHGHLYGLTIDSIEAVAREGLACVVHMELEGVLTLKNTHFEPRYVLILSQDEAVQERRLRMHDTHNEAQIAWMIGRTEMYAEYNREHPGFFDMMISSDDITEAYKRMRRLVMDYLGLSMPSPTSSEGGAESALDKEITDLGNTGTFLLGSGHRTWSKPSLPDSTNPQQPVTVQSQQHTVLSPMTPNRGLESAGRGVVEEESIKRRQSAAKDVISGYRPTIYEQILGRSVKTVPQPASALVGLEDYERSQSAPAGKGFGDIPPTSPDSSEDRDAVVDDLSNISEALAEEHHDHNSSFNNASGRIADIDPIEISSSKTPSSGPHAPRGGDLDACYEHGSPGVRTNSRLGSDKHQILPPIQTPPPPVVPPTQSPTHPPVVPPIQTPSPPVTKMLPEY